MQTPELTLEAVIATSDGAHSDPLRECAKIDLFSQNGVHGSVTLDCNVGAWVAKGNATFEGCG
jgi:hypothetical protein